MIYGLISFICTVILFVIIGILYYQQYQNKKNVDLKLEDLVSQINKSSLYAYNFDKSQTDTIQDVDTHVTNLSDTLKNISNTMKVMEMKTNDIDTLREKVNSTQFTIPLGNHVLASTNNEWVSIMPNIENKLESVGLLTDNLKVNTSSTMNGLTNIENLTVNKSLQIPGGRSKSNTNNLQTMLPYIDGINYIRGDTEISGNTKIAGDVNITPGNKLCIGSICLTEDTLRSMQYKGPA